MAGSSTVNATVKMVNSLQLIGYSDSKHAIVIDTSTEAGGFEMGNKPMELVLIALGGCTAMDVISIMKKKREKLTGLEIKISGERFEEHPKVYKNISLHYVFKGENLSDEAIERSISLSQEKYCSVSAMLKKAADVKVTWEKSP
ncbi:MAG: OsmC family protein [Acidobacteriota bacterium]